MATSGSGNVTIWKPDGFMQTRIYGSVEWWVDSVKSNRDLIIGFKLKFWKASGTTESTGLSLNGGYSLSLWNGTTDTFGQEKFTIPGGGGAAYPFEILWGGVLPQNTSNMVRFRSVNAYISGSTVMKNISFDFTADVTVPAGFAGNVANFTDEQYANVSIPINNPSGLECEVNVTTWFNGRYYYTNQKSGNYKVPFEIYDLEEWYNTYESVKDIEFTFRITSTIPGKGSTYQERKATMTIANANPVFNKFRCYDSNVKTAVLLDNDDNIFINSQSNMKVDVSTANKMTFKKGANGTNAKYIASFKTLSRTANYSATNNVSMDFSKVALASSAVGTSAVTVTAYDSRTNSTSSSQNVTVIDWQNPNPVLKIERTNPFATSINVQIGSGTFSPVKYKNTNRNSIKMARFSYKEKSVSSYNAATSFTVTQTAEGKFSSDKKTLSGFDVSKEYDFKIEVEDQLTIFTTYFALQKGKPNLFVGSKNNNAIVTVGKLPGDSALPDGSIDVKGNYYTDAGMQIKAIGSSWLNGRTTPNVIQFNNVNGNGNFCPLLRVKNNDRSSKDVATIGVHNNTFGFTGLSSASTANERTSYAYLDMDSNTWVTGNMTKAGRTVASCQGPVKWIPKGGTNCTILSYVANECIYYQVGNMIHATFGGKFRTTWGGYLQITGLPFAQPAPSKSIANPIFLSGSGVSDNEYIGWGMSNGVIVRFPWTPTGDYDATISCIYPTTNIL